LLRCARNDTKGDFSFIVVCTTGDNCCENALAMDKPQASLCVIASAARGNRKEDLLCHREERSGVIAKKLSYVSSRGTKCRGDLVHIPAGTVQDCFAAPAMTH